MKKRILLMTVCPIIIGTIFYGCSSSNRTVITDEKVVEIVVEDTESKFSISFMGDLLIHDTVYNAAKTESGYDFTNHFIDISEKLEDSDFRVINLEVPTAGNKDFSYSNYPAFNCPEQILTTLRDTLKIDLITNATNHSLDKGYKGLLNTIDNIEEAGIAHIGTYKDEESSNEIFMHELDNGIKIAFLNYTYGTNGIPLPSSNPYAVNLIDPISIKEDSDRAKELGADFIILKLHWGTEYMENESGYNQNIDNLDTNSQRGLAKYVFENTDVNLIVGDHPHVVQNIEEMIVNKDGTEKKGVVIYSLGNFISDQRDLLKCSGIIAKVNLNINKTNPAETKVESIEYTPVYVDRNPGSNTKKYRVVDINKAIADFEKGQDDLISQNEYNNLIYTRDYYRNKLLQDGFVFEK